MEDLESQPHKLGGDKNDNRDCYKWVYEKYDECLPFVICIVVLIIIILSLYQLNINNDINKTNVDQNQTIHSNDVVVRINCDNYYDLLHNEGLCDYLIDNNIHPCSEFYCQACRYRGYCDRSCGYCE